MNRIRHIIYLLTVMMAMTACTDDFTVEEGSSSLGNDGKGIGEMVQFAVGTTEHTLSRAADGKTYYMPDTYRFVCRMYYKAKTGSEEFDVEGGSDITAWLKVSGNIGNSLYWNKNYNPVSSEKGPGGVDEYGNDYGATAFYWQNRKEHAFLAWTNLNRATTIVGGDSDGKLKFGKDLDYRVYTGEKESQWITTSYKIYGIDKEFSSPSALREYVEATYKTESEIEAFNNLQKGIGDKDDYKDSWKDLSPQYQFGWSCKHTTLPTDGVQLIDDTHRYLGWYQYMMFFDKQEFTLEGTLTDYVCRLNEDETAIKYLMKNGEYVAEAEVTNEKNAEGQYIDSEGHVISDPDKLTYQFYETDPYGNVLYNENNPRYTFYYQRYEEKKVVEVYNEFPALAFDLTKGSKTSMGQQPDIVQAKEIQAPVGATQESNRVNLYFKHQFSQIQVNVKNAADNSVVDLTRDDILRVELLGVTEQGYIFTEIDKDGNVHPAAYKDIDFSKYNEEQLKENPYGTSFGMFDMYNPSKYDNAAAAEADNYGYPVGYLKSYNAIAFGQLQAIRITWRERVQGAEGYEHAATYRIPSTELMNLESGKKYVWNIEIRRGTLAIIRAEIVDWELPNDTDHNGSASGTIQNKE